MNFDEWKKKNGRKNMRRPEKRAVAEKIVPTSLFDFFWRLRIRANYRDVSTFLMSSVSDDWHQEFARSLLTLTELTCVLLGNLIVRYSGPRAYSAALNEFLASQQITAPEVFDPFAEIKRLATV